MDQESIYELSNVITVFLICVIRYHCLAFQTRRSIAKQDILKAFFSSSRMNLKRTRNLRCAQNHAEQKHLHSCF